jgi:hypothetical protein
MNLNREGKTQQPLPRMTIDEREALFYHLILFPALLLRARETLRPELFAREDERHLRLLWVALMELTGQAEYQSGAVPYYVLRSWLVNHTADGLSGLDLDEIRKILDRPEDCDPDDKSDFPGVVWFAYHAVQPEQTDQRHGFTLLQQFFQERAVHDVGARVFENRSGHVYTDYRGVLDEISRNEQTARSLQTSPLVSLDIDADIDMPVVKIEPTGVQVIDQLMGGGWAANEVYVLAGAYGAGKSTIGLQVLVERARAAAAATRATGEPLKHYYYCYCEGSENEWRSRFFVYAASIHKDTFTNTTGRADLSTTGRLKPYELELVKQSGSRAVAKFPGERERIARAKEELSANFHLINCNGDFGRGGISEIDGLVSQFGAQHEADGESIGGLVIDYVQVLARRYCEARGLNPKDHTRTLVGSMPDAVRTGLANRFQMPVLILSQFAGAVTDRPPLARMHHSDTSEAKNVGENADFCLCLGNHFADSKVGAIDCTKSRRSGTDGERVLFRFEGALGRFLPADDVMVVDGKVFAKQEAEKFGGDLAEQPRMERPKTRVRTNRDII